MCVGNQIGIELAEDVDVESLFTPLYGSFIVELAEDAELPEVADGVVVEPLGTTVEGYVIDTGSEVIDLAELQEAWESGIEGVFAYRSAGETPEVETIDFRAKDIHVYGGAKIARPRVIIPVFPGNNCEYDSARAFRAAGAEADTFVINNLTPEAVAESTHELARRIRASQIVMIPGGFSGGDEPDGSAKFITAFFRAPEVTEAVRDLLKARDGLMLGICNGFQALVKLGLVPYGDIVDATPDAPTLTFNTIGRHQSRLVRTRISSNLSPWLSQCSLDDTLHRRHQPRRGPLCRQRRGARPADRQRPGRHAVRGRGRQAQHGSFRQPQRLRTRHRGHHEPRRPRPGQDGPCRASRRQPVPQRARACPRR